jgi:hypothetical protein
MIQGLRAVVFALLMASVSGAKAADFKPENKPQNLKALFELVHHTVHVKKDEKQAAALFRSLNPDEARARKALRDGFAPDILRQIMDMHKQFGGSIEGGITKVARPAQTVVQVHGATTEEIARYNEGSVPYREFPGGTRRVAEQALRPGMTFYEVEYLEPGKKAGKRYHLVYWDGTQWSMLGPVWRVIKQ